MNHINDVLEEDFKAKNNALEEESVAMKIPIDARGCKILAYKFDKELGAAYKGGLFPFFKKNKGVCSVCDYLIFAERNKELYVLVVELKKGRAQTLPQLRAGECLADYIIATANRLTNKELKPIIRRISVKEFQIRKKRTKMEEVEYDEHNHSFLTSNRFHVIAYLK